MHSADNIELSEQYDKESDVYYVTVKTGEPSIIEEANDDVFLVEKGIFTNLPTGFRILNYSKYATKTEHFKPLFTALCKQLRLCTIKDLENRKKQLEKRFEGFFEKAIS